MANAEAAAQETEPKKAKPKPEQVHTWPNLVAMEFLCGLLFLVIIFLYSYYVDAPLRELANPGEPENPAKAPWYFLGLQEVLVYFDPWFAGVVLPTFIIVGLMFIPYIDNNPKGSGYYTFAERKFAVSFFVFGFIYWYVLIIIGVYCRGPFWAWFWPWEQWSLDFATPAPLWSPHWALGLLLFLGFFVGGMYYPAKRWRSWYEEMGPVRYSITMFFLLVMLGTIVKSILRLGLNMKYVLQTPWINF
ncbi:MAG: hypothetical protein GY800_12905 [Planctomycetes bacterium]|nr:hypothetical protein [Planctomycetota bacterium]